MKIARILITIFIIVSNTTAVFCQDNDIKNFPPYCIDAFQDAYTMFGLQDSKLSHQKIMKEKIFDKIETNLKKGWNTYLSNKKNLLPCFQEAMDKLKDNFEKVKHRSSFFRDSFGF